MKLCEVTKQRPTEQSLSKVQIGWLDSAVEYGNFWVDPETNLVNVNGGVIVPEQTTQLPVNFGIVYGDFYGAHTTLTSLKGSPNEVHGTFSCAVNRKLTSLEHSPRTVKIDFNCAFTNITSLEGLPEFIGGVFKCNNTLVANHVLQVLKYPQIKRVVVGAYPQLNNILNRYLAEPDRDILACQDELIDAGFAEVARL